MLGWFRSRKSDKSSKAANTDLPLWSNNAEQPPAQGDPPTSAEPAGSEEHDPRAWLAVYTHLPMQGSDAEADLLAAVEAVPAESRGREMLPWSDLEADRTGEGCVRLRAQREDDPGLSRGEAEAVLRFVVGRAGVSFEDGEYVATTYIGVDGKPAQLVLARIRADEAEPSLIVGPGGDEAGTGESGGS